MASVCVCIPELMLGSRIQGVVSEAGHDAVIAAAAPPTLDGIDVVVVDLTRIDAAEVAGRGVPVLGIYPHVDADAKSAAEAVGVDLAVPRKRAVRDMRTLLDTLLVGASAN